MKPLTLDRIAEQGIGIRTGTYLRLAYVLKAGVQEYDYLHTAVFGMN